MFGGMRAFPATDGAGRSDLIALVVPRPRRGVLARLRGQWIPGLMTPLTDAASRIGHIVICRRPGGGAIGAGGDWTEVALLYEVLRPVARCLAELHRLGIAHGSVAPGNLFATGDGAVVLGPLWNEPAIGGRRVEALPADDVHALGLTLLALFRGRGEPSLAHLVLPDALARLLRRMLSSDPAQRPDTAALTDPCSLLDIALPQAWMPAGLAGRPGASVLRH